MYPGSRATRVDTPAIGRPAPLAAVLLAAAGAVLVGAGALLSWRFGDAVRISDTVSAALAWCF
jgi:hypothetical protein